MYATTAPAARDGGDGDGQPSNIALDYIFIFPFGWGIFGAAFATAIAPMISIALLSLHFILRRGSFSLSFSRPRGVYILKMIPLGLSSMVTELSSAAALAAFNLIILAMAGNTGVAAYGVVANLALVELAVFVGIAQGMQPLVSRRRGMGDLAGCRALLCYGALFSLGAASLAYGAVFMWAREIAALFNQAGDRLLAAYAEEGLRIYFAGFFFGGLNVVTRFLQRGGDAEARFLISCCAPFCWPALAALFPDFLECAASGSLL
ncbi:MAG: MATE family efflux transporter [Cloacibacillus evryensis]